VKKNVENISERVTVLSAALLTAAFSYEAFSLFKGNREQEVLQIMFYGSLAENTNCIPLRAGVRGDYCLPAAT